MWFGALCELAELFRHTWEEGWLAVELILSFFPCKRAIGLPACAACMPYGYFEVTKSPKKTSYFFLLSCFSVVVRQSINKINSVKDSVGVVREPLDHCDLYALAEALCESALTRGSTLVHCSGANIVNQLSDYYIFRVFRVVRG